MIGIIVITHRDTAHALCDAAAHIVGEQEYVETICVQPRDGLETVRARIQALITQWEQIDVRDIVIMVDLFGGTPCNAAIPFLTNPRIDIVSGVNLSMLLTAITHRKDTDLPTLVIQIVNAAQRNILSVRSIKKTK